MRQPLVAGNWKMNGSRESIRELLDGVKAGMGGVNLAEVAVCAPYVYLADVQDQLNGSAVAWGGQDVSVHASGAYTGEISTDMLKDFGSKYAIVGHSERRTYHNESDELVAQKYAAARAAGLVPILCIGETLEEREQGITEEVCARQMDAVINLEGVEALADGVIAYEPVWAIGTGKTATPEQAQDVHAFIRSRVAEKSAEVAEGLRILYGGSMKPDNAQELIAKPDIDGGLIGGASLKAGDFLGICTAAG
ncbi:triose-phosphate isomerase [Solemya velesiana gill symbiont]|uniref:Triosephosphate isomerase n=1 Tax=Solemya velesiana gill symbiont TaxID=1918948 RepID=A0A1T2KW32_9GAMM|nr:triose-phosphate isomerase [Solemya velesiana gill symbiont]OOZ36956.1 triose-phosphate isomerase [Solemya velesiana gill symbiont]